MGLPFLNAKKIASIVIAKTKPEGGIEVQHEEGEHTPELMAAAEALISGIHSKNATAVADALKSAFDIGESEPIEDMEPAGE